MNYFDKNQLYISIFFSNITGSCTSYSPPNIFYLSSNSLKLILFTSKFIQLVISLYYLLQYFKSIPLLLLAAYFCIDIQYYNSHALLLQIISATVFVVMLGEFFICLMYGLSVKQKEYKV